MHLQEVLENQKQQKKLKINEEKKKSIHHLVKAI